MPKKDPYSCWVDVYRIYWPDSDDSYVGSSANIEERMKNHKNPSCSPNMKVSKKIKERGGYFEYEIIDTLWCEDESEGFERERWWQDKLDPSLCVNRAFVTEEEHKQQKSANGANYRRKNKQRVKERAADYRRNNKQRINERGAERVVCECGSEVRRNYLSSHRKTKKHKRLMELA